MCGIFCKINPIDQVIEKSECIKALNSISHRGPDDYGEWIDNSGSVYLGHRRLSIIDLSQHSHQPMKRSEDVIIYNGEIYNFKSIKSELINLGYKFESTGDTEVVLYACQQWGIDAVKKFRGMFAFVIWLGSSQEIIAVRDHLGIKPFYYTTLSDGSFVCSSEMKTFYAFQNFSASVNTNSLPEFLQYRSIFGNQTIVKEIFQLEPGQYLRFSRLTRNIFLQQYWKPEETLNHSNERSIHTIESYQALFNESVAQHLISDVPVGTQFSGGIDSSLVSAIAQKECHSHLTGYYCGIEGSEFDETPYAEQIATILGIPLERVRLNAEIFFSQLLDDMTWHMDEPINHPNSLGIYMISKLAKGKQKVLLSGESADEFFGGYDWYKFILYHNTLNHFPSFITSFTNYSASFHPRLQRIAYLNSWAHSTTIDDAITHSSRFINTETLSRFLNTDEISASSDQRNAYVRSQLDQTDDITATHLYDVRSYLPPLFMRQDKMSMAASIENRVPIAIPEILTAAINAPREDKISFFGQKKILKQLLLNYVPRELVYRRKWGFAIPLRRWFNTPSGKQRLHQLATEDFPTSEYFRMPAIRTLTTALEKSNDDIQILWTMVSYSLWARMFLGGGSRSRLLLRENKG